MGPQLNQLGLVWYLLNTLKARASRGLGKSQCVLSIFLVLFWIQILIHFVLDGWNQNGKYIYLITGLTLSWQTFELLRLLRKNYVLSFIIINLIFFKHFFFIKPPSVKLKWQITWQILHRADIFFVLFYPLAYQQHTFEFQQHVKNLPSTVIYCGRH